MAITFAVVVLYMAVVTVRQPLAEPVVLPVKAGLVLTPAPHVKWFGTAVIGAVAALYLYFW
jgi:hypothetical protein